MALSLTPERIKRYKDVVGLLIKYGRSDLVEHSGLSIVGGGPVRCVSKTAAPKAEVLAEDLEKLGPTLVKLGQLLSTRPYIIPEPYLDALSRLQDNVESFSIRCAKNSDASSTRKKS